MQVSGVPAFPFPSPNISSVREKSSPSEWRPLHLVYCSNKMSHSIKHWYIASLLISLVFLHCASPRKSPRFAIKRFHHMITIPYVYSNGILLLSRTPTWQLFSVFLHNLEGNDVPWKRSIISVWLCQLPALSYSHWAIPNYSLLCGCFKVPLLHVESSIVDHFLSNTNITQEVVRVISWCRVVLHISWETWLYNISNQGQNKKL